MAKAKWKNLKDQFRREYYKITRSESKPAPTTSKWHYFDRLQFLRNFITTESTHGNLVVGQVQENHKNGEHVEVANHENYDRSFNYLGNDYLTNGNSACSASQKRKRKDSCDQGLELQKKKLYLLEKVIESSKDNSETADLQFLKSLLPYMECLPLLDKLEVRTSIQHVVFEKFKEFTSRQKLEVQSQQQLLPYEEDIDEKYLPESGQAVYSDPLSM